MSFNLFELVPAVYRMRDAQIAHGMQLLTPEEQTALDALQAQTTPFTHDEQSQFDELSAKSQRGPLQSLLMVISEQLSVIAEDLDRLYDDQFIETCAPWVIPYIGDLIGYQSIYGINPAVENPRSEVAKTIALRRRKGTVLVLEQLARDITGWGAHASELFRALATTQYMKHVRSHNDYAPDVRSWKSRMYRKGGFSHLAHKVDVRNTKPLGEPRYNIQNIAIYIYSMLANGIAHGDPVPALTNATGAAQCYRLNSLGMDMPLYHHAISQGEQITEAARIENVSDRLHREELCADLQKSVASSYYGEGRSLTLYLDGRLLNPYEIRVANLSGPEGSWANAPIEGDIFAALIDPELGRVALPPTPAAGTAPVLSVSYFYGFNGKLGGGEYERRDSFTVSDPSWVFPFPDTTSPQRYTDLQDAVTYVLAHLASSKSAALEITDSKTYTTSSGGLQIDLPEGITLELRAADSARPTVWLDGEIVVSGDESSTLIVNGLVIAASTGMSSHTPAPGTLVHVPLKRTDGNDNRLQTLTLLHSTLVPGWSVQTDGTPNFPGAPSLIAEPAGLEVDIEYSIVGSLYTAGLVTVSVSHSIVDATSRSLVAYAALDGEASGGALTLIGCTVFGKVHAEILTLVSDSILWARLSEGDTWASALIADRRQTGCVRFSFVPVNAVTPRRFRCVQQRLASAQPVFFSSRYGQPGYAKMLACTDDSIRRGADDSGEMGAFHFLNAPQRESDLNVRLREYLPVGLSAGMVYQT